MSRNPLINALSASAYIILVATVINFVSQTQRHKPDTIFDPIAFLSLFTLSAAVMGYFFLYQPVQLYLDGKKKDAASLFVRTIGVFAAFTAIVLILLLSGII
jgi:hypothetical protein